MAINEPHSHSKKSTVNPASAKFTFDASEWSTRPTVNSSVGYLDAGFHQHEQKIQALQEQIDILNKMLNTLSSICMASFVDGAVLVPASSYFILEAHFHDGSVLEFGGFIDYKTAQEAGTVLRRLLYSTKEAELPWFRIREVQEAQF